MGKKGKNSGLQESVDNSSTNSSTYSDGFSKGSQDNTTRSHGTQPPPEDGKGKK